MLQYHFNWKVLSAMAAAVTWWNFYFRLFPGHIHGTEVIEFLVEYEITARTQQIEGLTKRLEGLKRALELFRSDQAAITELLRTRIGGEVGPPATQPQAARPAAETVPVVQLCLDCPAARTAQAGGRYARR